VRTQSAIRLQNSRKNSEKRGTTFLRNDTPQQAKSMTYAARPRSNFRRWA
jgi:hypothetical protein